MWEEAAPPAWSPPVALMPVRDHSSLWIAVALSLVSRWTWPQWWHLPGLLGGVAPSGNSFPSPTTPTVRRILWVLDLCQAWSRRGRYSRVGQARSAHGGCQPRAAQACMVRCQGELERHTARGNAFQTQSVIKFRDYYYCGEGSKKALSCIVGTWALL